MESLPRRIWKGALYAMVGVSFLSLLFLYSIQLPVLVSAQRCLEVYPEYDPENLARTILSVALPVHRQTVIAYCLMALLLCVPRWPVHYREYCRSPFLRICTHLLWMLCVSLMCVYFLYIACFNWSGWQELQPFLAYDVSLKNLPCHSPPVSTVSIRRIQDVMKWSTGFCAWLTVFLFLSLIGVVCSQCLSLMQYTTEPVAINIRNSLPPPSQSEKGEEDLDNSDVKRPVNSCILSILPEGGQAPLPPPDTEYPDDNPLVI